MHGTTESLGKHNGPLPVPRRKVLLVDDNLEDLLHFTAVLQHEGYEVRPLASHSEGANRAGSEDFDLVIVSQGSRAFEGRVVLASAIERNRHTPVLVLASYIDIDCYLEAMQLGAFDYREKPLDATEIVEVAAFHFRPPARRS